MNLDLDLVLNGSDDAVRTRSETHEGHSALRNGCRPITGLNEDVADILTHSMRILSVRMDLHKLHV